MLSTRLDLAFAVNKLAQYSSNRTIRHWPGVKRIIRFVKHKVGLELTLSNTQVISPKLLVYPVIG